MMVMRVRLSGGRFYLTSAPGKGVRIEVRVPRKAGNWEQRTGNREQGTGNREQGTGNRLLD